MPKSTPDLTPDPTIDITRLTDGWPELEVDRAVAAALSEVRAPNRGELSVVLSDDAKVRVLNRDYRHQDKPTNVLSFPMPEGTGLMGDVVFALETVQREAVKQGKAFADHFTHLLIHGVLHLQGFDHEDEAEADAMEAMEIRALASLGIANPYHQTD